MIFILRDIYMNLHFKSMLSIIIVTLLMICSVYYIDSEIIGLNNNMY